MSVHLWWKHVARCLWTAVSYNFWLFATWLLILATYRFDLVSFMADKGLVLVRYVSLTEIGSLIRSDFQILAQQPYLLFVTFFLYGFLATWFLRRHGHDEAEIERETDRPWWEVLPVDSYWINCLFRPMATLTRPLPPSELELEEGIEMLIERLAVPNLWLQPVIPNEYIKDLPVWKFRGWDALAPKKEAKHCIKSEDSPEIVEKLMDAEDPYESICRRCIINRCEATSDRIKFRHQETSPSNRKKKSNCIESCQCKCFTCGKNSSGDSTTNSDSVCEQGSNFSASSNNHSESCSLCSNRQIHDVDSFPNKWESENVRENHSHSEESGDETSYPPSGMLPTTECAVCLETYRSGVLLCGLPCGHNYHQCCIMIWLGRDNHHCPVCRWPAYKSKHLHRE